MKEKKTLILTDNEHSSILANELKYIYKNIDIFQSPNGLLPEIAQLHIENKIEWIIKFYDLVISIHCKQIFPIELINGIRCINVHPGLNPYNRGWFPHVFSIINGLPSGVTIHEIDEKIDHGPIITQEEINIEECDTSESAYKKIIDLERKLLLNNFEKIKYGNYQVVIPKEEGNINYKKDYEMLKYIDPKNKETFGEFINRLRALSHGDHKNAFFLSKDGKKIFLKIILENE